MTLDDFFQYLWADYTKIAPAAKRLHEAVAAREGDNPIVNDHVAFRTYDIAPINLDALERHVLAVGYERFAPYEFKEKKLRAFGYVHKTRRDAARIFLSELKTAEISPYARDIVQGLVAQVDPRRIETPSAMWSGRLWKPVEKPVYDKLLAESDYAAWVSVFGLRANHFTISVNHLKTMTRLEELLDFVESLGYKLNTAGGRVKGTPRELLEQGSNLADEVEVEFAGGVKAIVPSCYYEFARRYSDPQTGKIYDGFVAASADKIFESTNVRR